MARLLHIADMHLDSSFTSRLSPKSAQLRRSEQRAVFSKIINFVKESADILLIAGDLFDSENVSDETVKFLISKFRDIPDKKIFIAPGNHDMRALNSVYETIDFGENVYVFTECGEYYDIDEYKIRVCGVGFLKESGEGIADVLSLSKHDEYTNIALVHGNVQNGKTDDRRYNPISVSDIESSGFDYLALGHVHTYSGINKAGLTYWAYPGIPEPRGFDECAEHGKFGVIFVDTSNEELKFEFKEVYERLYHEIEIILESSVNNTESVIELIMAELLKHNAKDLFKFILVGNTECGFKPNLELIEERLKDKAFFATVKDKTEEVRDISVDESDMGMRAVFIRMVTELIESTTDSNEKIIAEKALKIGVDALDGRL